MSQATNNEIKAEASEMTSAQKVEAATQIINSLGPLAKEAGPLAAGALHAFASTIQAAPQMLVPALNSLLMLPLPQPLKNSIKRIIQQAKVKAPGPKPKTHMPLRKSTTLEEPEFPWVPVIAGVGVLGALALIFTQTRKRK